MKTKEIDVWVDKKNHERCTSFVAYREDFPNFHKCDFFESHYKAKLIIDIPEDKYVLTKNELYSLVGWIEPEDRSRALSEILKTNSTGETRNET